MKLQIGKRSLWIVFLSIVLFVPTLSAQHLRVATHGPKRPASSRFKHLRKKGSTSLRIPYKKAVKTTAASDHVARQTRVEYGNEIPSLKEQHLFPKAQQMIQQRLRESDDFTPIKPDDYMPLMPYTFQARPLGDQEGNLVSGVLFKINYQGNVETYGAIASHILSEYTYHSLNLAGREFVADVFDTRSQRFVTMEAEVVQLSSPKFLNVTLVKFNPPAGVILEGIELNTEMPKWGSVFASQGFVSRKPVYIGDRRLIQATPFSIRTTLDYPHNRQGYCGGLLVEQSELLKARPRASAMHTGSRPVLLSKKDRDIGYAAPAWIFEKLVEAYHNNGKATIRVPYEDRTILELNVDEYIFQVTLRNNEQKDISHFTVKNHFSYQDLQERIDIYRPRYIDFIVHRVEWDQKDAFFLFDTHSNSEFQGDIYRYDMKEDKITRLDSKLPESVSKASGDFNQLVHKRD